MSGLSREPQQTKLTNSSEDKSARVSGNPRYQIEPRKNYCGLIQGVPLRISKKFRLGLTQPSLDFVDVDTRNDTKVFISPSALATVPSDWGNNCVHLIQSFFRQVLGLIKAGKNREAEELLLVLREPNETHLGLSKGKSQGRALGKGSAKVLWHALSTSEAAKSGLLTDLEDAALMIEGISVDIISDMTTNIIRGPLIEYTQRMCDQHGIPTTQGVDTGPCGTLTARFGSVGWIGYR
ncbi:hypothetical protein [Bradyrhizobium sp. RDT46]|uniref:hypothetical protein n=1 Tax=Bradyrhizobium sp. RDT46 TaxID=3341829 RepID=UPI0035C786C7